MSRNCILTGKLGDRRTAVKPAMNDVAARPQAPQYRLPSPVENGKLDCHTATYLPIVAKVNGT
jgi:hypothetical protein